MHADIRGPEDAPDLVCLHGGTGTGAYHWSKLSGALAQRWRVHLPDLPGHGQTPLPDDATYDRALLVDAVAAYLEELGEPAHVAGFSMGGHAALELVARGTVAFASLTLIGVSHRDHEGLHAWREGFDPDVLAERYPLWARHLSRLHEPLGGPEAWRDVCRRDAGLNPDGTPGQGLEIDVDLDALAALDRPVLLVRGDRDAAVQPEQYAELREIWEQADELVVPAGRHDVQMTRHSLVEEPLLDFLARASDDDE